MSISVPSEYVPFVNELVALGIYPSQDAVMRDALQLLREKRLEFEDLKAEIAIGIEQANRGEMVEHACVKAKWQMRLAEATAP